MIMLDNNRASNLHKIRALIKIAIDLARESGINRALWLYLLMEVDRLMGVDDQPESQRIGAINQDD